MRGLITAAALAITAPATATEFITNGGFETGTFAGWTRTGALGNTAVNAAAAASGLFGAAFSPNQVGSIEQQLSTLAGHNYRISFDLAHTYAAATPINSFSFSLSFDGQTIQSFGNYTALPFTHVSLLRTATAPASVLKFNFRDARPTFFYLDNVSVTGQVPEPASWMLLIAGFGAVGTVLRGRRRVAL